MAPSSLIAVVDDEPDIRGLVAHHLERAGFRTRGFRDAGSFMDSLRAEVPSLLVLDLMLPDMHGTEVCRKLRSTTRTAALPIIMLTALTDETDRISGLEMGADDYVTKPFSPRELVARCRAVLRRFEMAVPDDDAVEVAGRLLLEPERFRTIVDGRQVDLTPTEFRILLALVRGRGRILSRSRLLEMLWHGEKHVIERTIDVHIRNIRKKLGDLGGLVVNVRGMGYKVDSTR